MTPLLTCCACSTQYISPDRRYGNPRHTGQCRLSARLYSLKLITHFFMMQWNKTYKNKDVPCGLAGSSAWPGFNRKKVKLETF